MFEGLASRAWMLVLAASVVLALPYWSVSPIAADWLWAGIGWTAVGAVLLGVRLHKPAARAPWYLLAGSLACFIIGDNIYSYLTDGLHASAYPSVADAFYLAMYPMGFVGLSLLVHRRSPGHDRGSVLDAAVITTSLGVWSWVLLISPYMHGSAGIAPRLVSAAYPLCDIAMLAVAARLAVGGGRRTVAFFFIVAGIAGMLVADALYGYKVLDGSWHDRSAIDALWIAFYLLWGAAALHPSMRLITEAATAPPVSPRRRVALMGGAAIAPSVLQLVHPISHDTTPIAIATVVMFVLVTVRMTWLIQNVAGNETAARSQVDALHAAQEHSRQKSMFLANMSHEIRTPLNGVVGMIELLRETELDNEQRDYANTLASSAVYLAELVNDILDFSRVEAGKLDIEAEPFELRQTVDEALHVGASRAHDKGVDLVAIVDADVPDMVVGDHIRVRQVLGNLVSNATKFTNAGHIVVRVASDAGGVRFDVEDTGIGLHAEGRERLFEQFVQADQSTTRQHGGSGLGLAICKQLVTLMGGEIGVTSERGAGSTFWFDVPLVAAARRDAARPLRGRRFLVASTNAFVGSSLEQMLEHWGAACVVATTCADALRQLSDDSFDALLVDDDVRALAAEVRATASLATIPILALSSAPHAASEPTDVVSAWMIKPVGHAVLLDRLQTLLGAGHVQPFISAQASAPRHTGCILVVEDNLVNQKVAVALLTHLGYDTEVATDGVEALTRVEHQRYDAILMDCQMPRMDGYETTLEIRRRENGPRVPIIAMTASALFSDRERCLDVGMDDYLTKPINRETLATTLEHFLTASV